MCINNETWDAIRLNPSHPGGFIMPNIKLPALFLLLLFFSIEAAARDSIACLPQRQSFSPYWAATSVFTGVVDSVETGEKEIVAKFTVEKAYRGVTLANLEVATDVRHGYPFQKGGRYFVYAWTGSGARLYVDICSPTKALENASEDIEYAEDIAAGKRGTRIHGTVYEYRNKLREVPQNLPLAGMKVTIRNENGGEFMTLTDEKGRYVFKEVADGTYTIKTEAPAGTHLAAGPREKVYIGTGEAIKMGFGGDLTYRRWDGWNFLFTSSGSIRGRIGKINGRLAPQQYVELLALDDQGKLPDKGYSYKYLWTNKLTGEFAFDMVAPGKYLLAINPNGCHNYQETQYGTTFFPGVAGEVDARVITVGENQEVKLKNFKLLPPLKERWISGTVTLRDGTPAANATVFIRQKDVSFSTCQSFRSDVKTDAEGKFRIKGYEPYEYLVRAFIETGAEMPRKMLLSQEVQVLRDGVAGDIKLVIDP